MSKVDLDVKSTLTVRLIRSFEHRNIKHIVLRDVDLSWKSCRFMEYVNSCKFLISVWGLFTMYILHYILIDKHTGAIFKMWNDQDVFKNAISRYAVVKTTSHTLPPTQAPKDRSPLGPTSSKSKALQSRLSTAKCVWNASTIVSTDGWLCLTNTAKALFQVSHKLMQLPWDKVSSWTFQSDGGNSGIVRHEGRRWLDTELLERCQIHTSGQISWLGLSVQTSHCSSRCDYEGNLSLQVLQREGTPSRPQKCLTSVSLRYASTIQAVGCDAKLTSLQGDHWAWKVMESHGI